jgi:hypothetical protein
MRSSNEANQKQKLTHTNTDLFCADTTSNVIIRVIKLGIYRFNLWTGTFIFVDINRERYCDEQEASFCFYC